MPIGWTSSKRHRLIDKGQSDHDVSGGFSIIKTDSGFLVLFEAVLYLANASWVTGVILPVDGDVDAGGDGSNRCK